MIPTYSVYSHIIYEPDISIMIQKSKRWSINFVNIRITLLKLNILSHNLQLKLKENIPKTYLNACFNKPAYALERNILTQL